MADDTHHSQHPGFNAGDCHLRITVSGRRTDGGMGGYACSLTGGHCLPASYCGDRREAADRLPAANPAYVPMELE